MAAHAAELSLCKYCLRYDVEDLRLATGGFSAQSRLGTGAYGSVFHGTQRDATEVAVKVLNVEAESGFEEEVRVLSKFRHPNLVILMGFASCGNQRMLVYEFLGGGDVYARLAKSNTTPGQRFPWKARLSAARDAACGLAHLHNSRPRVFHRDIKSPNILLDRNGSAKMADFGLACLSDGPTHTVKAKSGTVGYACPHYTRTGVVTEASEVYSFGMVLLEILTASPAAWPSAAASEGQQAWDFLVVHINGDAEAALRLTDVSAEWPQASARSLAELALRCTTSEADARPDFVEVVHSLRSMIDTAEENSSRVGCGYILEGFTAQRSASTTMPRHPSEAGTRTPPAPPPTPALCAAAAEEKPGRRGTSLAGDVEPMFLLHASGSGLRAGPALQDGLANPRCVVHGPARWAAEAARVAEVPVKSFKPLMLGRAMASEFWHGLLNESTFAALSREHLLIEACAPCRIGEPAGICVKNLSAMHPVRICSSCEDDALDAATPLAVGERRRLKQGEFILVVECKRTKKKMLLLRFEDIRDPAKETAYSYARTGGA